MKEIQKNPQISVVVDANVSGGKTKAVVFEGKAELLGDRHLGLERGGSIYTRYLGVEGALRPEPQSWLRDPDHLLIRLKPARVFTWGVRLNSP